MFKNDDYSGLEKAAADFARDLHIVSGLHVGIHDLRQTHFVSAGDNVCNICKYCKKRSALFENRCICSDKDFLNLAASKQKSMVYLCHLGLVEAIIPIVDGDTTVGVIFLGQARTVDRSPSFDEMFLRLQQIDPMNFSEENKEEIRIAYDKTVSITAKKLDSLISLSEFIAQSIYVNRWLNIQSVTTEQNFRHYMRDGIDIIHIPLSSFSVEKIADELNISYSQLNRLSREYLGLPLKQHVLKTKISAAARLLSEHPDMSVGDVAASVGIENIHYFSRIFSERMGVSCTEYRKKSRSVQ